MGDLIPFKKPNVPLTKEEEAEYQRIFENIKKASSLRDVYYCKKQVKEFKKKINKRINGEKT
jgi:hypothetical protein